MLKDTVISRAIIEKYMKDLLEHLNLDVAVVGAGPSGLVAAYYLAMGGAKVAVFEKKLSIGGGIWGGAMGFNKIVVEGNIREIIDDFNINYEIFKEEYYILDAIETVAAMANKVVKAGVKIFNMIEVEDVIIKNDRVSGIVINWTPVLTMGLAVDPLTIESKFTVDSTGHGAQISQHLERRGLIHAVKGEGPMWAEMGEKLTVENTKEIYPGLYVTGMAANSVFGAPRMGPIFGGMFMSGRKAAMEILKKLNCF